MKNAKNFKTILQNSLKNQVGWGGEREERSNYAPVPYPFPSVP